jgi:hypothetical protein
MDGFPNKISRASRAGYFLAVLLAVAGIIMFAAALIQIRP